MRCRVLLIAFLVLGVCSSCSDSSPPPAPSKAATGLLSDPVLGVADTGTRCAIPALRKLWTERASSPPEDYALGPGDEITLSVPEVDELQSQRVRVSQAGTIGLPLIGTVELGGLTESQARAMLEHQLAKYMKNPRLEMYVDHYRSRGVAVAGAVQRPGVYDLASFGDTLNDMIAMAGGLTTSSAQQAVFLPAASHHADTDQPAETDAVSLPEPPDTAASDSGAVSAVNVQTPKGFSGDLANRLSITLPFGRSGDMGCLNMPARPGDVIIIPAAGTVTVVGWVRNPGSFAISPGMTVLGAITAAGGAIFSWSAEILRTDEAGARVIKHFSLRDLENGTETDIPVESGDVVRVEKSAVGAVPYALWEVFEHFGTGVGIPIP